MDSVRSPCNSVCEISAETGWCRGCLRTLDEIATWTTLTHVEKRELLQQLEKRRTALPEEPASGH